jgi:hypothetical protein
MSERDPKTPKEPTQTPKPGHAKEEIKSLNADGIEELDDKDLEQASGGSCTAYAPCDSYA